MKDSPFPVAKDASELDEEKFKLLETLVPMAMAEFVAGKCKTVEQCNMCIEILKERLEELDSRGES